MAKRTPGARWSRVLSARVGRPFLLSWSTCKMSAMAKSPWREAMISRVFTPLPPWISLKS